MESSNQLLKPAIIEEYVSYPTFLEKSALSDVEEQSIILISDKEVVDLLRNIALTNPSLLKDAVAIISEPEPEREEAAEYNVLANWFLRLGVQHYVIRSSGHYYPYELKKILTEIKPENVIPIHTEKPKLFNKILYELKSRHVKEETK
jgi:ribonuclease J